MDVTDRRYFKNWLRTLSQAKPAKLWQDFTAQEELPSRAFSLTAAAVYSANIEGNPLDLNSFLQSKLRGQRPRFKAKEHEEIELIAEAYAFAGSYALNEKNLLTAHGIMATTLMPKAARGKYRDQMVYVYSRAGMEYAALEPEYVPAAMRNLCAEIRALKKTSLDVASVFYHAALIHLVFVHIHPFMDGNGRAARLLEKWFLASHLGRAAWHVPSEWYYKQQRGTYYRNIKLGLNYYTLDYDRCVPFLTMLVKSLTP